MPKTKTLILWFLFTAVLHQVSTGQFYDRTWLIGGNAMIKLTFNGNVADTSSFYWGTAYVTTWVATSNVSDTAGNILFYTEGCTIGNSITQIMENGDTLTDSLFYNNFAGGFGIPQTNLILPRSGNTFYLFYVSQSDSLFATNTSQEPDRLYYAVIDMDANGGLGKVISKKNVAYKGLFGEGRLTACRHANGRDWWMVHQGSNNDQYFIYLVTPDSVYAPTIQSIGPTSFNGDAVASQSTFSQDGSKLATVCEYGPIAKFDFDRCSGLLSNSDSFVFPMDSFTLGGILYYNAGSGICFSPSGRFLYVCDAYGTQIMQFDTWAPDIASSLITVGYWENSDTLAFNQMYLLPNGQIIIDDGDGTGSDFHLIDSPDVAGMGCHFMFDGLPTNTVNADGLPNMINYQLGALAGSGCDTLTGIKNTVSQGMAVKVYPNPASDIVFVDAPGRDLSETLDFVMYDMLGQEILRQNIPLYEIEVARNNVASGIYTWQVQSAAGQVKAAGKLVWE